MFANMEIRQSHAVNPMAPSSRRALAGQVFCSTDPDALRFASRTNAQSVMQGLRAVCSVTTPAREIAISDCVVIVLVGLTPIRGDL
jgi:hypothetical protein